MKKLVISKKTYNFISKTYRFGGFFTIVGLLISYALLIGRPIEFMLIFLPYFFTKGYYSKQYHAKSLKQCFLMSLGIFALATTITLPKSFTLLFSFTMGLALAYASCHAGIIQFKLEDYAYIEPRYNQLVEWYNEANKPKPFDVDTCTDDEFYARCKELNIRNDKLEEIYDLFHISPYEYTDKYSMEYQSVCNKRQRYRTKFNKKD